MGGSITSNKIFRVSFKIPAIDLKPFFNNNFRVPGNQLLESDIVYVRDPVTISNIEDSMTPS